MRSINLTEINNTVQQLNGIIWENLGDIDDLELVQFGLRTNGDDVIVDFCGMCIWDTIDGDCFTEEDVLSCNFEKHLIQRARELSKVVARALSGENIGLLRN